MKIQFLGIDFLDAFLKMRMELFRELGEISNDSNITDLIETTKQYYIDNIEKNLLCWGILMDEEVVSIASLCLFSRIPYFENLHGREGYILNIYTMPKFRKRGFAKELVQTIIDYAQKNGIKKLWLNSSEQGQTIYTDCGFTKIRNAMEMYCHIT